MVGAAGKPLPVSGAASVTGFPAFMPGHPRAQGIWAPQKWLYEGAKLTHTQPHLRCGCNREGERSKCQN